MKLLTTNVIIKSNNKILCNLKIIMKLIIFGIKLKTIKE
jgi:hypothetical protein